MGSYADQLISTEDVTAKVRAAVTATIPAMQVEQRDKAIADIQTSCQAATGLQCQVVTFYQGGKYSLYRYKRYGDVRLVMAPEEATSPSSAAIRTTSPIRAFDLDLTLLRVYENGQPSRPRTTSGGVRRARTRATDRSCRKSGYHGRLLTMAQMEYLRDVPYPATLAGYKAQIAILQGPVGTERSQRRARIETRSSAREIAEGENGYQAGLVDSIIMSRKGHSSTTSARA